MFYWMNREPERESVGNQRARDLEKRVVVDIKIQGRIDSSTLSFLTLLIKCKNKLGCTITEI